MKEIIRKTDHTLLFALLLLFFFQLLGMWVESMYRMSLTRLGPGMEYLGILLLLLSLSVFVVKTRFERLFLWMVLALFLVCRLVCPHAGVAAQVVIGGLGVSLFLIFLSYALSMRYLHLQGDAGAAIGLAVLLSVTLRIWGSSSDISTEGSWTVPVGVLALWIMYRFRTAMSAATDSEPEIHEPCVYGIPAMLGLFANITLVFLVFSCPAVVCAWSGYAQLGWPGMFVVALTVVSFSVAVLMPSGMLASRHGLAGALNLLLALSLAGGLYLGRPTLPMSAPSPTVFMDGAAPHTATLFYVVLLLSGLVVVNVRHIARFSRFRQPQHAVLSVLLGMLFLFVLTLLLIFSNVWGYVPFGHLMRNRFYLPFLFAGAGILVPWMIPKPPVDGGAPGKDRLLQLVTVVLVLLTATGIFMRITPVKPPEPGQALVILTYNMQLGSHENGNRNYTKQLELLRQIDADIISLQESDAARPSGGNMDAVRYIAESLGYHACYGPGAIAGTFGTAILSRYPIRNTRLFFTYSDTDEVCTTVAEIDVNGTTVAFFSNHPAGAHAVMNAHVDALVEEVKKYNRVIAAGDFNFRSHSPWHIKLATVLDNSAAQIGEANVHYHGGKPSLADKIDHLFLSRNFRTLESHYLPPPDSQTDHPAHWSVVAME